MVMGADSISCNPSVTATYTYAGSWYRVLPSGDLKYAQTLWKVTSFCGHDV